MKIKRCIPNIDKKLYRWIKYYLLLNKYNSANFVFNIVKIISYINESDFFHYYIDCFIKKSIKKKYFIGNFKLRYIKNKYFLAFIIFRIFTIILYSNAKENFKVMNNCKYKLDLTNYFNRFKNLESFIVLKINLCSDTKHFLKMSIHNCYFLKSNFFQNLFFYTFLFIFWINIFKKIFKIWVLKKLIQYTQICLQTNLILALNFFTFNFNELAIIKKLKCLDNWDDKKFNFNYTITCKILNKTIFYNEKLKVDHFFYETKNQYNEIFGTIKNHLCYISIYFFLQNNFEIFIHIFVFYVDYLFNYILFQFSNYNFCLIEQFKTKIFICNVKTLSTSFRKTQKKEKSKIPSENMFLNRYLVKIIFILNFLILAIKLIIKKQTKNVFIIIIINSLKNYLNKSTLFLQFNYLNQFWNNNKITKYLKKLKSDFFKVNSQKKFSKYYTKYLIILKLKLEISLLEIFFLKKFINIYLIDKLFLQFFLLLFRKKKIFLIQNKMIAYNIKDYKIKSLAIVKSKDWYKCGISPSVKFILMNMNIIKYISLIGTNKANYKKYKKKNIYLISICLLQIFFSIYKYKKIKNFIINKKFNNNNHINYYLFIKKFLKCFSIFIEFNNVLKIVIWYLEFEKHEHFSLKIQKILVLYYIDLFIYMVLSKKKKNFQLLNTVKKQKKIVNQYKRNFFSNIGDIVIILHFN
nr:hypothetical protein Cry52Nrm3_p072 [Cryptomonas curvata]